MALGILKTSRLNSGINIKPNSPAKAAHLRVHPILHWTEKDIWRYHQRENIPFCDLYLAQEDKETGKMMRYRSLGEKNITFPVESNAASIEEIIEELETTNNVRARRPHNG